MSKNYRDGLFRDYFNNKPRLLSLCNALLNTNCSNPDEIVINTLDGVFFSQIKNDLSCLFQNRFIIIIEHQSTKNENMPVRCFFYLADLMRKLISAQKDSLYKESLIKLPKPEMFVFYNGNSTESEKRLMRLSDAFDGDDSVLELKVELYNLNEGKNAELLSRSRSLEEYCIFVNRVKSNQKRGFSIEEAIREAVEYCCNNNVMRDYLEEKKKELFDMVSFEFDIDEAKRAWKEEAEAKGEAKGKFEATLFNLKNLMNNMNWTLTQAMDALKIPPEDQPKYASMLQ